MQPVVNYCLECFSRFHRQVFIIESFLFHLDAAVNAAIHNIKKDLGTKELDQREILGKISSVRDVTAKDDCSFVRNDFVYEVKGEEYEKISREVVQKVAADSIADAMEWFDKFSKELFVALLCHNPDLAQKLNLSLPAIFSSFEDTKDIVLKTEIKATPFKGRINNTNIRKYLHNTFPQLKAISEKDNNMGTNYVKLIENLVIIRHAVTHDNATLSKTPKVDIGFMRGYIDIGDCGDQYRITPTKVQSDHILDMIQEYAFLLAKYLSRQMYLPWSHATFSWNPEMMYMEGKFPLFEGKS